MTSGIGKAESSLSAFDRMEAKADRMLDEANAMAELNTAGADNIHRRVARNYVAIDT